MTINGVEYPLRYSVLANCELCELVEDGNGIDSLFGEQLTNTERTMNYAKTAVILNKAAKFNDAYLRGEDVDKVQSDLTVEAFMNAEYGEIVVAIGEIISTIRRGNMSAIKIRAKDKKKISADKE